MKRYLSRPEVADPRQEPSMDQATDPLGRPRKIHKCSPQPNACLHVAHNWDNEWWEVEEIPGHPPKYYGPYSKEDPEQ